MSVTTCTSPSNPLPAALQESDASHHSAALCGQEEAEQWFALRVKPRQEKATSRLLEAKGYEAFLPLCRQQHHYGKRLREFDLVLFPGYLFCRFDVLARLPVLTTPGIIRLVGAGPAPVPVDEREINALRTAVLARLPMEPHPFLQTGARVQITGGSLAGVEGIVVDLRNSLRLVLSITLLQRSVLVEIDRNLVRADGNKACSL
ncbi:MAG TPA: transcription termination/antitermination NusG family protein [Terriglobales bacterium]|nr:transcription termination/antitermination NusG family protein [Terriglobales bacterium]